MEKTKELFDKWNEKKILIDIEGNGYKRTSIGEIWIYNIGINIGSEISKNGKFQRPCLIVSKGMGGDLVTIIPVTTKYNDNFSKFLVEIIDYEKFGLKYKSYLCFNQIKTISKKRLVKKVSGLNNGINKNWINKQIIEIMNLA